ncbi:MAG: peroxide stress protein YaaA [Lachnospiraceae bacterium]
MRIIISPAKKMAESDALAWQNLPEYIEETKRIKEWLQTMSLEDAKTLWRCNDKIARCNYERFQNMALDSGLSPAILAYEGIQYQYMAPAVFETEMLNYIQEHLRILSGFYGVLRPLDGITPYRLEMQADTCIDGIKGLYDFWGRRLYDALIDDSHVIVNLASKEYSKCIEPFLQQGDRFITCVFGEESNGKVVQKGVYAKMARGEMVRFMAEKQISDMEEMKTFCRLGYGFRADLSSETKFVFIKQTGMEVTESFPGEGEF